MTFEIDSVADYGLKFDFEISHYEDWVQIIDSDKGSRIYKPLEIHHFTKIILNYMLKYL